MEGNNYEGKLQVKQDKQKRCSRGLQKKSETELAASVLKKKIQNTQEIRRTLLNGRNRTKRAKFRGNPFVVFA